MNQAKLGREQVRAALAQEPGPERAPVLVVTRALERALRAEEAFRGLVRVVDRALAAMGRMPRLKRQLQLQLQLRRRQQLPVARAQVPVARAQVPARIRAKRAREPRGPRTGGKAMPGRMRKSSGS